jgi:Dolichyl-phosphate-mannose-protein mannosyltransferase
VRSNLLLMKPRWKWLGTSPWVICFAALVLRLGFVFYQGHLVPREALATVPFQNEAGSIAAALAQGKGFCCLFRQATGPTAWLAPVYPSLLAGIFKVFGVFTVASFYAAAVLNCIFSALVCVPLCGVAERAGNRTTAITAGWLWAVFPSGILIPFEWIWDTSLSALLAAALLWFAFHLAEKPSQRNFIFYGLFWGFSLLVNPALGAPLPFLLLWLYLEMRAQGLARSRDLVLAVALTVLVCIPWTIRNAVQFHRVIPIRSDFPFELWMGNNAIYDQHSREINRITRYEQVHLYSELGETAFLDEKGKAAREFIVSHPALCLQLAARRAIAFWLGTVSPWQDFLRSNSLFVRFLFGWNALTALGTTLGLACLWFTRRNVFLPLAAFPVAFPLVYYVTQESLRLHHPCDPALALLMALAAAWPWWRTKRHANEA